MRKIFAFSFFTFLFGFGHAQISDSIYSRFADEFAPEKTYLHFDKSAYTPGETVWFKAYLLSGYFPSTISKNFYADWYDESGKLLKHLTIPILSSTARNQFDIPADYKGRSVTLKAYTQWMLNFDTAFIFSRAIPVIQKNGNPKTEQSVTRIDFLPEGGYLVNGIQSVVAFKAVNQTGNPVKVRGTITDNTGKKVGSFSSVHDGMGSFLLKPETGITYSAQWTNEYGETGTLQLPAALTSGVVLNVQPSSENMRFSIRRTETGDEALSYVYIVGMLQNQRVYQARVNLSKSPEAGGVIPLTEMPDGVIILTVFNKNWQPLAERAAFIRKKLPEFDADIKGKFSTAKRGRNELEINLIDTLSGTFSVAVTDADLFSDSSTNIFSHFLLSADIKGKVFNPAFYFQNTADSTLQYLDLVMRTNGWRKIMWQELVQNRLPQLWFQPETRYMNFTGKVFGATPSQLKEADALNLIIQTKDSSKQILQVELARDGSFALPQLVFYDTLKVFYQFNKKNSIAARTSTKFDNGFRAELYKRLLTETNITEIIPSDVILKMQRYAAQQAELERLMKGTTLEGVTVRTRKKDPMEILDEKYTSGFFNSGDGYRFDVANDVSALGSTVLNYLQGRVAGLQINASAGTLSWRGSSTSLFLNEMPVQADQIMNLPMSDVAYVKVFRPPFFGGFGGGSGGAVAVYTKKGGEGPNLPGKGLEFQYVSGYSSPRQFYSPDYSKDTDAFLADVRTTIYWNSDVIFNRQNTQVKINFYNNDSAKRLRVIIEGMDEEGKLFHYTRIIE